MIGKKIKARVYGHSSLAEEVTILDKIRGIYYDKETTPAGVHTMTHTTITIDYYLCRQENGTIVYVLPSSIEEVLEANKKPKPRY